MTATRQALRGRRAALAALCLLLGCGPPQAPAEPDAPAVVELAESVKPAPVTSTCRNDDELACTQASDAGDAESCARLAAIMLEEHTEPDRAAELFSRACEQGSGKGCNGLGVLQQRGALGEAAPEIAATHYRRACEMGYTGGCYNLAQLLMHTLGKPAQAIESYRQACDRGSADGCAELGALLLQGGEHAERDVERAEKLLDRGCRGDVGRACHNLSLSLQMRGEQARAAQERARGCKLGNQPSCEPPQQPELLLKD